MTGSPLQVPQLIFGPAEPDPPLTIMEGGPPPGGAPEPGQLPPDKSESEDQHQSRPRSAAPGAVIQEHRWQDHPVVFGLMWPNWV